MTSEEQKIRQAAEDAFSQHRDRRVAAAATIGARLDELTELRGQVAAKEKELASAKKAALKEGWTEAELKAMGVPSTRRTPGRRPRTTTNLDAPTQASETGGHGSAEAHDSN